MALPRRRRLLQLCAALTTLIAAVAADCFNPNHTNRNLASDVPSGTEPYIPCNTVEPYSICCRNSDSCLPNGLCQQAGSSKIWRESCTDQSWNSGACLKLCASGGDDNTDQVVEQCADDSWCCASGSHNATSCCEHGLGNWIVDGKLSNINPNGTSSSGSSSSSASSTRTSAPNHHSTTATPIPAPAVTDTSPTPAPSASTTKTNNNHTPAIVGGTIGAVAATALIVGLILFLLRRRKHKKDAVPPNPQITPMAATFLHEAPGGGDGGRGQGVPYQYQTEKQGMGGWNEMQGSVVAGELQGEGRVEQESEASKRGV